MELFQLMSQTQRPKATFNGATKGIVLPLMRHAQLWTSSRL